MYVVSVDRQLFIETMARSGVEESRGSKHWSLDYRTTSWLPRETRLPPGD